MQELLNAIYGWWDFIEEANAPPFSVRRWVLSPLIRRHQRAAASKMAAELRG